MSESLATITHDERARQLHLFLGMVWKRKISPMNIDYYQEFDDRLFIMGDGKLTGASLTMGTRIAIERGVDAWAESGRHAVGFIYTHDTPPDIDVLVKDCVVPKYRWQGEWLDIENPPTVMSFINRVLKVCGMGNFIITEIEGKPTENGGYKSAFAPIADKYKDAGKN